MTSFWPAKSPRLTIFLSVPGRLKEGALSLTFTDDISLLGLGMKVHFMVLAWATAALSRPTQAPGHAAAS
jgi:hypothetical protein